MEFMYRKSYTIYGEKPQTRIEDHSIYGYWRLLGKDASKVRLEVKGWKYTTVSVDGKPASVQKVQYLQEAVVEGNTLDMGYGKMVISY
jgi:hypothetical protein